MKLSRGMSSTEAGKVACELAPDVFAHIHKDSLRRWSYDAKPKVASAGRKKKVTDIQREQLSACPYSGRLRQAKLRVSDKKQFSAVEKQTLNDSHRRRIWWTCRQNSIIPARVYNMDESFVELVPTPRSAWTFGKEDERPHLVPGDGKVSVTVSVALPLSDAMPVFSLIIFKGETDRVVPQTNVPDNMLLDHSASRWQTVATLLRLVGFMQARIGDLLWMLILDHAPIHASEEFQTKVKDQFPQLTLLFLDRGCTSVVQPCDTH
eukprot:1674383-Amphidinium_carterae.1